MLGGLGGFFVRATLNDNIFKCFFLGWNDSLGKNLVFFHSEYKNLVAGILEVKLKFLLSELAMNIDIQFKGRCFQLCMASSSQRASDIKNFC